jgi:hypothetical protein
MPTASPIAIAKPNFFFSSFTAALLRSQIPSRFFRWISSAPYLQLGHPSVVRRRVPWR